MSLALFSHFYKRCLSIKRCFICMLLEKKKISLLTTDFINTSKNIIFLGCSLQYCRTSNSLFPHSFIIKGTWKVKQRKHLFISLLNMTNMNTPTGPLISIQKMFIRSWAWSGILPSTRDKKSHSSNT